MLFAQNKLSTTESVPLDMLQLHGKLKNDEGDVSILCSSLRTISTIHMFTRSRSSIVECRDQYKTKQDTYVDVSILLWKTESGETEGVVCYYNDIDNIVDAYLSKRSGMSHNMNNMVK